MADNPRSLRPLAAALGLALALSVPTFAAPASAPASALPRVIDVDGKPRKFNLFAPPGSQRAPLVITLHGHGQSATQMERLTQWNAMAAQHGAVVAYPIAMGGRWRIFGPESPDVDFLLALIDALAAEGLVDPARVFVNGYSGGAQMSWRFACQEPTRVVAAGFVAGAAPDGCGLGEKPPVLMFHGEQDPSLPYEKGHRTLDIPELGRAWAARAGCTPEATVEALDGPGQRAEGVRRHRWACDEAAPVLLYSFRRGGHDWPGHPRSRGSTSVDATATLWEFFEAHAPAR
jgi:polyhydroxybutyrate depolymerase